MNAGTVRDSFGRCEATGDFAEKFYSIFLSASSEIAPLFAQTDFAKQRKLLRATVFMMVSRDTEDAGSREALERIGGSHSRSQLDIRPELYELWLESLCTVVRELDPEWTEELDEAWRNRMRPGISLITSLYES